jgi:integrase/recombinase XerD
MMEVPAPKFKYPPVEPFTKEEVEAILKACDFCEESQTDHRYKFAMRRDTASRDWAIILVILDTRLRATELGSIKVGCLDNKSGKVII